MNSSAVSSSTQTLRQRLSRLGCPAVAAVVLYAVVFAMPLRRTVTERLSKLDKLQLQVKRSSSEHSSLAQQVEAIAAEEHQLAQELRESTESGAHLVSRRADRRAQVFSPTSPASLLARTLELLDRHGLECLDSSIAERRAKPQGDSLDALKPVADLLGVTPGEESERREVRIKLMGRFQELQHAIRDIHHELEEVFILSLDMEPSEAHRTSHTWYLTLSL